MTEQERKFRSYLTEVIDALTDVELSLLEGKMEFKKAFGIALKTIQMYETLLQELKEQTNG